MSSVSTKSMLGFADGVDLGAATLRLCDRKAQACEHAKQECGYQ